MGYQTSYSLYWKAEPDWKAPQACGHNVEPKQNFCPECGMPSANRSSVDQIVMAYLEAHKDTIYGIDADGSSQGPCKWYEHNEDMTLMSKDIPNVLFALAGEGEESGDLWRAYYLNGKTWRSKAEIVYPPLDRTKLK